MLFPFKHVMWSIQISTEKASLNSIAKVKEKKTVPEFEQTLNEFVFWILRCEWEWTIPKRVNWNREFVLNKLTEFHLPIQLQQEFYSILSENHNRCLCRHARRRRKQNDIQLGRTRSLSEGRNMHTQCWLGDWRAFKTSTRREKKQQNAGTKDEIEWFLVKFTFMLTRNQQFSSLAQAPTYTHTYVRAIFYAFLT